MTEIETLRQTFLKGVSSHVDGIFLQIEKLNTLAEERKGIVSSLSDKVISLTEVINSLSGEIERLSGIVSAKSIIEKEIADSQAVLAKLNKEIEKARTDFQSEKEVIASDIKKSKEEYEEWANKFMPTLVELNERERLLTKKEQDLRVVEQRWKKKYESKGMRFKVTEVS